MNDWVLAKYLRLQETDGRCEVCAEPIPPKEVRGHHIKNRKDGRDDSPSNCEVRCGRCETKCHKLFPDGNVPPHKRWEIMVEVAG